MYPPNLGSKNQLIVKADNTVILSVVCIPAVVWNPSANEYSPEADDVLYCILVFNVIGEHPYKLVTYKSVIQLPDVFPVNSLLDSIVVVKLTPSFLVKVKVLADFV